MGGTSTWGLTRDLDHFSREEVYARETLVSTLIATSLGTKHNPKKTPLNQPPAPPHPKSIGKTVIFNLSQKHTSERNGGKTMNPLILILVSNRIEGLKKGRLMASTRQKRGPDRFPQREGFGKMPDYFDISYEGLKNGASTRTMFTCDDRRCKRRFHN